MSDAFILIVKVSSEEIKTCIGIEENIRNTEKISVCGGEHNGCYVKKTDFFVMVTV